MQRLLAAVLEILAGAACAWACFQAIRIYDYHAKSWLEAALVFAGVPGLAGMVGSLAVHFALRRRRIAKRPSGSGPDR